MVYSVLPVSLHMFNHAWQFQKLVRSSGYFIIHVEDHGNSDAILLADRLASFYLVQHVPVQLTSSAVHSTL